ncbi:MAG: ABC transporter ATP-binding protein, partial [Deltaproteobacteria bacterium]
GVVQAGVLVAFVQYIRRFFVPIRDLSTKYTVLQSAFAASERVFALRDEPIFASLEGGRPLPRLQQGLRLDRVWFSYRAAASKDEDYILRDISLEVRRGEHVALVGATGSGKSTILKLLGRFVDVQRGAVLVDQVNVSEHNLSDLRRLFAVVLQDVHLFSGTLLQNVAFAARVGDAAAKKALRDVGADGFIERLPQKYDTQVFEQGVNFSAGERQLLALARALALDPQVLILDEATSNIDSETEARIQSALNVLLTDRTALVVAHRLSTIQKMDRIVVLEHGRVRESGSHAALMRQGGLYADLVSHDRQSAATSRT